MDLGEALYEEITGRSPHSEIHTFGKAIQYLVTRAGSASAAARVVGVAPSTFRHWISSGRRPSAERAGFITELAMLQQRRDRLPKGRERRMRRPGALDHVKVNVYIIISDKPEERTFAIGDYLREGVQDDLLDAYLDGANTDELAEMFADAIEDSDFYAEAFDPYGGYDCDVKSLDGWA